MKRYLSNLLKAVATGSFTLILAACYGMPIDQVPDAKTLRVRVKNPQGVGIPNILVDSSRTDATGTAQVTVELHPQQPDRQVIQILDTDGDLNGSYNDTSVTYSQHIQELDVELTPKP